MKLEYLDVKFDVLDREHIHYFQDRWMRLSRVFLSKIREISFLTKSYRWKSIK